MNCFNESKDLCIWCIKIIVMFDFFWKGDVICYSLNIVVRNVYVM